MADALINREFFLAYDSSPMLRGDEERYLCPWCGNGKPRDNAHRSCCLNLSKDIYGCKRCKIAGKCNYPKGATRDPRVNAEIELKRQAKRMEDALRWSQNIRRVKPITEAALARNYFETRGISWELAHQSQARFSRDFFGGYAVLFPLRNKQKKLIGINARYTEKHRNIKHRTVGEKINGVYATRDAFAKKSLVITEAPFDALSLAMIGVPAIATCGAGIPHWLSDYFPFKRVIVATDRDKEGELMAQGIMQLACDVTQCLRIAPNLEKDWNAVLVNHGIEALEENFR